MVEWWSAARPVIPSTRGGLREALAHAKASFRVHPTPAHLLEAITRLRDEPTWRRALAAVAPPDENPAEQERAWVATHEAIYRAVRDHGGLQ